MSKTIEDHIIDSLESFKYTPAQDFFDKLDPKGAAAMTGAYNNITIRIPDDTKRTNRWRLRADLFDRLKNNSPIDSTLKSPSVSPIEAQEDVVTSSNDQNGKFYRIFFYKSGKQTAVTEYDESMVCYALSCRQSKGSSIDANDLKTGSYDDVHAYNKGKQITIEDCFANLDDEWVTSAIDRANGLYNGKVTPKSGSEFHRGSPLVGDLEDVFKKIRGKAEFKYPNLNINKWNPADIWISKGMVKWDKDKFDSIADLNSMIGTHFDARTFIGVSLKKSFSPVFFEHVPAASLWPHEKDKISIKSIRSHTFKDYNTQQVVYNINYGEAEIEFQFRTFGGDTHQGNITKYTGQSSKAVHGKIAAYDASVPTSILNRFKSTGFFVKRLDLKKIKETYDKKNDQFYHYCANATQMIDKLDKTPMPKDFNFHEHKSGDVPARSFAAKYLSLQIAYMIDLMSTTQQEQFWSEIIAYAASQIPGISSDYLKNK